MKDIIISLLIFLTVLLLFVACVEEYIFQFDHTYLEILSTKFVELPHGEIEFRAFISGHDPQTIDESYFQSIALISEGQDFAVDSVWQKSIEDVDVFLLSDDVSYYTLLYDHQRSADWTRYLNYQNQLESFDVEELFKWWAETGRVFDAQILDDSLSVDQKKEVNRNFYKNLYSFFINLPDDAGKKLFVLYINDRSEISGGHIERILEKFSKQDNWWFGIFYEGSFTDIGAVMPLEEPLHCLFCLPLTDCPLEQQYTQVMKSLDIIKHSEYIVRFSFSGDVKSVNDPTRTEYSIALISKAGNKAITDNCKLQIDAESLGDYYVYMIEELISKDISENNYQNALERLLKEYRNWHFMKFEQDALNIFETWFLELIGQLNEKLDSNINDVEDIYEQSKTLMSIAEDNWNTTGMSKYKELKVTYLLLWARLQEQLKRSCEDKIATYDMILQEDPNQKETYFKLNVCKADLAIDKGRLEDAVKYGQNAWKTKKDSQVLQKLRINLEKLLDLYYQEDKNSEICTYADQYQEHLKDNFRLKYYWALAAIKTHKTQMALEQCDWLMQNWSMNKEGQISWDELLNKLFYIYAENLEFDESYNTLKRICVSQLEEHPDLIWALIGLRSKYMKPLLYASQTFLRTVPRVKISSFKEELDRSRSVLPPYLKAVYTLDSAVTVQEEILGYAAIPRVILKELKSSPRPMFANENDTNWYIMPIQSGFLVLQSDNSQTPAEEIKLGRIEDDIGALESWYDLERYIDELGQRETSIVLAMMIGIDYAQNGQQCLKDYGKAVRSFPMYRYFVVQNKEGNIVHSLDYDKNLADFPEGKWSASSKAALFYKTEIEYGGDKLFDIAYPIIDRGQWLGVIRLGLKVL